MKATLAADMSLRLAVTIARMPGNPIPVSSRSSPQIGPDEILQLWNVLKGEMSLVVRYQRQTSWYLMVRIGVLPCQG